MTNAWLGRVLSDSRTGCVMSQRCAPSERGFCSTVPYSAVVDPNVCRIRLQSRGQHAVCDSFSVGSVGWAGWLGWLAVAAYCMLRCDPGDCSVPYSSKTVPVSASGRDEMPVPAAYFFRAHSSCNFEKAPRSHHSPERRRRRVVCGKAGQTIEPRKKP